MPRINSKLPKKVKNYREKKTCLKLRNFYPEKKIYPQYMQSSQWFYQICVVRSQLNFYMFYGNFAMTWFLIIFFYKFMN